MRLFGYHLRRMTVFFCFLEAMIVGAAFIAVAQIVAPVSIPASGLLYAIEIAAAPIGMLFLSLIAFGAYNIDVMQSPRIVAPRVVAAAVLGGAGLTFFYLIGIGSVLSPVEMIVAELLAVPAIILGRTGLRHLTAVPALSTRALVFGTGRRASDVWAALADDRLGRLAGFVSGSMDGTNQTEAVPKAQIIPRNDRLASIALENSAGQIVIALDEQRGALPTEELLECRMQGIAVHNISTFLERETGQVDLETMRASWLVFDEGFSSGRLTNALKRCLDIAASLGLLIFFAPLMLLTALAVRLDSRGPIFYRQTRIGLGGEPYEIVKFRSMVQDAEQNGKAQWAVKRDPRITRIGAILRKSRLDELPQAFNVLSGEMSFVGPRPERPEFVAQLAEQIPYYNERHRVKPGITGWAQINYPYGASVEDARKKLKYDLYYVKNKSLVFDLLTMLQTVRIILFAEGAR